MGCWSSTSCWWDRDLLRVVLLAPGPKRECCGENQAACYSESLRSWSFLSVGQVGFPPADKLIFVFYLFFFLVAFTFFISSYKLAFYKFSVDLLMLASYSLVFGRFLSLSSGHSSPPSPFSVRSDSASTTSPTHHFPPDPPPLPLHLGPWPSQQHTPYSLSSPASPPSPRCWHRQRAHIQTAAPSHQFWTSLTRLLLKRKKQYFLSCS